MCFNLAQGSVAVRKAVFIDTTLQHTVWRHGTSSLLFLALSVLPNRPWLPRQLITVKRRYESTQTTSVSTPPDHVTSLLYPTEAQNECDQSKYWARVLHRRAPCWQLFGSRHVLGPRGRVRTFKEGVRQKPDIWDICNGCILWLPSKRKVEDKLIPDSRLSRQARRIFDHPVLVLAVNLTSKTTGTLTFAIMTSRGNKTLSEVKRGRYGRFLPIAPSASQSASNVFLHLENDSKSRGMTENSYVSLSKGLFELDWAAFQCYSYYGRSDGFRYRLTKESFKIAAESFGIEATPWIETRCLWKSFIEKYQLSADQSGQKRTENPSYKTHVRTSNRKTTRYITMDKRKDGQEDKITESNY